MKHFKRALAAAALALCLAPSLAFSQDLRSADLVKILLADGTARSISVNDYLVGDPAEVLLDSEQDWLSYSRGLHDRGYIPNPSTILGLSWKDVAGLKPALSSGDIEFEVFVTVRGDDYARTIIKCGRTGLEDFFTQRYGEQYTSSQGLYYPASWGELDWRALFDQVAADPLSDRIATGEFASYVILPGALSNPANRAAPSLPGQGQQLLDKLKDKYQLGTPVKGFLYDYYLSGVAYSGSAVSWAFVLHYRDPDAIADEVAVIEAHLAEWKSFYHDKGGLELFVELGDRKLTTGPNWISGTFPFKGNKPKEFWYTAPLNRNPYF